MEQKPIIKTRNLTVKYDDTTIVHNVNFDVYPGGASNAVECLTGVDPNTEQTFAILRGAWKPLQMKYK